MDLFSSPILSPFQKLFYYTPFPSGDRQHKFTGNDRPQRPSSDASNQEFLAQRNWNQLLTLCQSTRSTLSSFAAEHCKSLSYDGLVEYLNPALFITMANKEDNPTYAKAMSGPDAAGFIDAMEQEIMTLI